MAAMSPPSSPKLSCLPFLYWKLLQTQGQNVQSPAHPRQRQARPFYPAGGLGTLTWADSRSLSPQAQSPGISPRTCSSTSCLELGWGGRGTAMKRPVSQPLPHLPCTLPCRSTLPCPLLTLPENEVLRLRMARRDGGVVGDLGEQGVLLRLPLRTPKVPYPPPPFPCEPEEPSVPGLFPGDPWPPPKFHHFLFVHEAPTFSLLPRSPLESSHHPVYGALQNPC